MKSLYSQALTCGHAEMASAASETPMANAADRADFFAASAARSAADTSRRRKSRSSASFAARSLLTASSLLLFSQRLAARLASPEKAPGSSMAERTSAIEWVRVNSLNCSTVAASVRSPAALDLSLWCMPTSLFSVAPAVCIRLPDGLLRPFFATRAAA